MSTSTCDVWFSSITGVGDLAHSLVPALALAHSLRWKLMLWRDNFILYLSLAWRDELCWLAPWAPILSNLACISAIWLKPWSFTNNNLPFLMVITVFWFSGLFPSKRGVRGVPPSCVVREVTPTDARSFNFQQLFFYDIFFAQRVL